MASLTPFQLRAAALRRSRGPITPAEQPKPLKAVQNRVWLAAKTVSTRFDAQLFVYALVENEVYGTRGFTHIGRLPRNSEVADEFAQAINFALKNLPRDQKTALHTDLPVLVDLSDFEDLQVIYCASADNPAAANLERFIRDSNPYR